MVPDINHGRCSVIVWNIIIFVISRSTFRGRRGGRVGRGRRGNESFPVDTVHERMQVSVVSPVQVRDQFILSSVSFRILCKGGQMKVCRTIGGAWISARKRNFFALTTPTLQNHTHFRPWLHLLFFGQVR